MKTIHAIYENGLFRPTEPVELPEHCEVEIVPKLTTTEESSSEHQQAIQELLKLRFNSGQHDTAERHNEHQP